MLSEEKLTWFDFFYRPYACSDKISSCSKYFLETILEKYQDKKIIISLKNISDVKFKKISCSPSVKKIIYDVMHNKFNGDYDILFTLEELIYNFSENEKNLIVNDKRIIQQSEWYNKHKIYNLTEDVLSGNSTDDLILIKVRNALKIINSCSLNYYGWVNSVIKYICVTDYDGVGVQSSSDPKLMGVIELSIDDNDYLNAESIIHEASHQYFYITQQMFSFIKPSHRDNLYYSIIKKRYRKLSMIMLAHHAIFHMVNFWLQAKHLVKNDFYSENLNLLLEQYHSLSDTIKHSDGLTEWASFLLSNYSLYTT